MIHHGSCHCGRIAYDVEGDITQVMQCNCSHCARKGFNGHHIRHQFCAVCGCEPFAFGKDKKGADTVAVNVRCLPDLDPAGLEVRHFDGRSP